MECRISRGKCVDVGDHVVVVAEVLKAGEYEGIGEAGLIYVDGRYRRVGQVVRQEVGDQDNEEA